MMRKDAYTYILTNTNHTVLSVGVTSDLGQRVSQHKTGFYKNAFSSRYNLTELVYYEEFDSMEEAIIREKQLKAGSRQKKIGLITGLNPQWNDLMKKNHP